MTVSQPLESAPEAPQAQGSILSALKVRDFRLVWAGESVSLLGDQFYMVALPWLTLQLTGSGLALGAVAAAGGIPRAIFMLVGGAITDRFSPRSVMFVSNALRVVLTALITILVLSHTIQFWMLFVAALLFGLVDAFFFPASSAIIPMIVDKDQLESGNGLMQITSQLANFVGPALAGLIIASLSGVNLQSAEAASATGDVRGIGVAIGLDVLTFLFAAGALWFMKGGRAAVQQQGDGQSVLSSIREGLQMAWSDPPIRTLIFITAGSNLFFNGPMTVGIPILAKHLPEGAAAFGALVSSFGGGAFVGAILGGTLPTPRKLGIVVMTLMAGASIGLGALGFVNSLPIWVIISIGMGLAIGYVNVAIISWTQKRIPGEKMGRIMSLFMLASFGLGPISNFVSGLLVDNHYTLMFVGAGLCLMLLCVYSLTNREVRTMNG